MYENVHTKQVCSIERIEVVNNPPIRVYVLSDGSRWYEGIFLKHWRSLTPLALDGATAPMTSGDLPADVLDGEGSPPEPPRQ